MAQTPLPIGSTADLRDMLKCAGVGDYTAAMSIQYMNFLPSTTDPYAQGVIQIVEGLQVLLNKQGASLAIDGGMGVATTQALMTYAGPRWFDKSWAQLYADVMNGRPWAGWTRRGRGGSPSSRGIRPNMPAAPQTPSSGLGAYYTDLGHTAYHHLGDVAAIAANPIAPYGSVLTVGGGAAAAYATYKHTKSPVLAVALGALGALIANQISKGAA